ncbi:MAG: hypothetical protein AAB425_13665 [Bdellovibrionota bacterium]
MTCQIHKTAIYALALATLILPFFTHAADLDADTWQFTDSVRAIANGTSGSAVVGGAFQPFGIVRVETSGRVDPGFVASWLAGGANGPVNAVARLPDGSYLIGGEFTLFDVGVAGSIARLEADGRINQPFMNNTGSGFDGAVNAIALLADGSALVGGSFEFYNGRRLGPLAHLSSDGFLVLDLVIPGDLTGPITALQLSADRASVLVGAGSQVRSFSIR